MWDVIALGRQVDHVSPVEGGQRFVVFASRAQEKPSTYLSKSGHDLIWDSSLLPLCVGTELKRVEEGRR